MLLRLRRALAAHQRRIDAVGAAAFAILSLAQVLVLLPIAPRAVGAVVALGSTLPIAFRRTHPVAAALTGSAVWLIPTDGYVWLGYVAAFLLFYSLAVHTASAGEVAAVVAFGAATGIIGSLQQDAAFGEYFGAISSVAAPAVAGRVVRRLRTLTHELEQERERSARSAVADERTRIARELHDVVAHGLSVIAIQADAAEAALDREPGLARTPLATIRGEAREALAEMRRLLGMLREPGAEDLAPQPGLDQLAALVQRARAAGVRVEVEISGEPRPLPASLDLSAYRILQEALTNVRKHAPDAPASIRIDYRDAAIALHVRDRGEAAPANGTGAPGHGLVGMRERARLHGGVLHAGAADGGGFEVQAVLPL